MWNIVAWDINERLLWAKSLMNWISEGDIGYKEYLVGEVREEVFNQILMHKSSLTEWSE